MIEHNPIAEEVARVRDRWTYLGTVPIRGQLDFARLGECYMADVAVLLAALHLTEPEGNGTP